MLTQPTHADHEGRLLHIMGCPLMFIVIASKLCTYVLKKWFMDHEYMYLVVRIKHVPGVYVLACTQEAIPVQITVIETNHRCWLHMAYKRRGIAVLAPN